MKYVTLEQCKKCVDHDCIKHKEGKEPIVSYDCVVCKYRGEDDLSSPEKPIWINGHNIKFVANCMPGWKEKK